ncbi:hypothetical protein BJF90_16560 [Pseudonocardia sp. CNS-004]|nr:hypothetical protein BJF90_16560 [Pseudonocardia sp. CNS-004]
MPDFTLQMHAPIVITVTICATVVLIVYFLVRDSDSEHRAEMVRACAEVVRALAGLVRAAGEAARKILEAIFGGDPGRLL